MKRLPREVTLGLALAMGGMMTDALEAEAPESRRRRRARERAAPGPKRLRRLRRAGRAPLGVDRYAPGPLGGLQRLAGEGSQ